MLTLKQRELLHGARYVEKFEKNQSTARLERLLEYMVLNQDDLVVDFACGNGLLMQLVANKVKQYVGVDFSESFIRAAEIRKEQLNIFNAKFVCDSIEHFCKINKNCFDAGFAMDFSEHVYDDEWLKILKGIRDSLKETGKLYLHTPNADFFLEFMKKRNFIFKQFPEHVAVRTPTRNIELLRNAGFTNIKLYTLPHYNILRLLHPFSYVPVVGKYFEARIFIVASR